MSVLEVNGVFFKHLTIDGDTQLGGRDIDEKLREYAANEINKLYHTNLLNDSRNAQILLQMCKQWKKDLTTQVSARCVLLAKA